jgi:hypothetical protein
VGASRYEASNPFSRSFMILSFMTGFPNVAIVVGDTGSLVVDTGLGPRNGAVIAQVAKRLSKGSKLYLTRTARGSSEDRRHAGKTFTTLVHTTVSLFCRSF